MLQERLSNPAFFTFAWVFVIYNWQAFGWFLFEPLMFSLKLENFKYTNIEVYFWAPLGWTFLVIALGRGLNNFTELCQRVWDQLYASFLKHMQWKEFIDSEKYNNVVDEKHILQDDVRKLNTEKTSLEKLIKDLRSDKNILENEK